MKIIIQFLILSVTILSCKTNKVSKNILLYVDCLKDLDDNIYERDFIGFSNDTNNSICIENNCSPNNNPNNNYYISPNFRILGKKELNEAILSLKLDTLTTKFEFEKSDNDIQIENLVNTVNLKCKDNFKYVKFEHVNFYNNKIIGAVGSIRFSIFYENDLNSVGFVKYEGFRNGGEGVSYLRVYKFVNNKWLFEKEVVCWI